MTEQADHTVADHTVTAEDVAYRRVVCLCVDYSQHARQAVLYAIKHILTPQDLCILLHVRPEVAVSAPYGLGYVDLGDAIYHMEKQERNNSHLLLKDLAGEVKRHGIPVRAIALRGDPRDEILRKASQLHASLLICGSRGLSALKRTFMGSCSTYLVNHSDIPVMVVKMSEESMPGVVEESHPPVVASVQEQQ